jgi:hypothetical protein
MPTRLGERVRSATLNSSETAPVPVPVPAGCVPAAESQSQSQSQSPADRSQRLTPSRPRRRTVGENDDNNNNNNSQQQTSERRSSLVSRKETTAAAATATATTTTTTTTTPTTTTTTTPVPPIPARFLRRDQGEHHSQTPSPRAASHSYNNRLTAAPASSPLAYDFDFSFTADPPLRASPSRHSLLTCAPPRHAANKHASPVTNFSTPLPAPRARLLHHQHTPSHTRASSLPTTKLAGKRRPSKDESTLQALTRHDLTMDQTQPDTNGDLFLQVAEDENSTDSEPTLTQRATSRASRNGRRQYSGSSSQSAAEENARPRTTGHPAGRSASRFSTRIDTNRANGGYNTPGPAPTTNFISPSYDQMKSGSAQPRRKTTLSNAMECSPRSASRYYEGTHSPDKSPELPTFGRRRPSFGFPSTASQAMRNVSQSTKPQGSDGDSPANSSEAKQSAAESDSVDSQTAPSTVWDELDDLKSRIKKLELTGKIPSTSNAAVVPERPRTATTAPTTINSSPKQDRKSDQEAGAQNPKSPTVPTLTLADIHPTLHIALAKAKALLSASLYRTLEATAMDALQLVAMTGSAGPQGTAFSAASIINGVTVSDRHIRRKADMMCRNLTDLCLALCEGKHETPGLMSSPIAMETPPSSRISASKPKYSRSSLALGEDPSKVASRPFSRLEARRSSILGVQPSSSSMLNSPQASGDDISISEYETTPSHTNRVLESRRQSRLGNRLSTPRLDRHEEPGRDEDVRPPSRAVTEFGNFRATLQQSPREYSGITTKQPHRSPSLRESLNARRANASTHVSNREVPRVASLNLDASRRRFPRESTPPVVLEEEPSEQVALAYQRRRLTSFGHYVSSRRAVDLSASRSSSMSHRQPNIMIE